MKRLFSFLILFFQMSLFLAAGTLEEMFFEACDDNNVAAVRAHLNYDLSLANTEDSAGFKAVYSAILFGHKDVVIALLQAGADVNYIQKNVQLFLLDCAVLHERLMILALLLSHEGVDVNIETHFSKKRRAFIKEHQEQLLNLEVSEDLLKKAIGQ